MKKFVLLIAALFLFYACASNQTAANDAMMTYLTDELSGIQASIASLQSDVDALTLKNESLSADLLQNSNTISELRTDVTYLSNEVTILKGQRQVPVDDKTPKIVIIEDSQAMIASLYSYAFQLYQEGNYEESIEKFHEFLSKWSDDNLSNNAQYWIGENYYAMRDFQNALSAFQAVSANYPRGAKVPDAMLKIGYTYYEMGNSVRAKEMLNSVIKNHPKSSSANLARQTLAKWK